MKNYTFNLKEKEELIKTPRNKNSFDFTEFREFQNQTFGIKRNWKTLLTHNNIDSVKRVFNTHFGFLLSSFKARENQTTDCKIYIDFGKYTQKNNCIIFYDLELDIIISHDYSFKVLDMDELLDSYYLNKISNQELRPILENLQSIINDFTNFGVVKALENIYDENAIKWLIE